MKLRVPDLPDDSSTEDRFRAIVRKVVTTTNAEVAEKEAAHQASKAERGIKKRGPTKGTIPKHLQKG